MGRRQRGSDFVTAFSDAVFILSRLPWQGTLIFGLVVFAVFYWFLPAWIEGIAEDRSFSQEFMNQMMQGFLAKHIHKLHWFAYACGIATLFFTIRNYYFQQKASSQERGVVGFISRLLGRWMD